MAEGTDAAQEETLHRIEKMLIEQHAQNGNHWHIKKEVTVAHLLSTIGVVGLVVASWFSLSAAVRAYSRAGRSTLTVVPLSTSL